MSGIRRREAFLLLPSILLLMASASLYYLLSPIAENKLLLIGALLLGCSYYLLSLIIARWAPHADEFILPVMAMLNSLGITLLYHINPNLAGKQWLWSMLGLAVIGVIIIFLKDYFWLAEIKYSIILLAFVFLILTILVGDEAGGARNWLSISTFRFQPVEIVKFLVIIFTGGYFYEHKDNLIKNPGKRNLFIIDWLSIGPIIIIIGLLLSLLTVQKDLGAALIFFAFLLALFFIVTGRLLFVIIGLLGFSMASSFAYFIFAHVRTRVAIWLDPWPLIDGVGYQTIQSFFALAQGGIFGMGLGMSLPGYIPAVATDFIFSIAGAELGFLGATLIITFYFFLSLRGFKLAEAAPEDFGFLLATGLSLLFAIQTLVIIGGILNLLPLTGVTLPLMSYGGSSLVINCVMLGLLIKLSSLFQLKEEGGFSGE